MSNSFNRLKNNDLIIASLIFLFFFLLYRFRYTEFLGDAGAIVWAINDAIDKGKPAIRSPQHWLETYAYQLWIYFCDFFSIGVVPLKNDLTTRFASGLNRITILNSLLSPLMLSITYLFTRSIGGVRSTSFIATCLFGLATSTWMLSTCPERQIMAIFFLSLAFWSTSGLRRVGFTSFIFASLLCSTLIILTVLIYLPLMMFIPIILLVSLREIVCEKNEVRGVFESSFFRIAIFILLFIAVDYLFKIACSMSFISIILYAKNYFVHFGDPGNPQYWSKITSSIVLNNILCLVGYFSPWAFSRGVHTTDLSSITELPYGLGYLGISLSISLSLFVIFNSIQAVSHVGLIAKIRSADRRPLYRSFFGLYIITGCVVVIISRLGVSSEYWSFVLWAMVPLLGLKEKPLFRISKKELGCFIVPFLLVLNFSTGWHNFFHTDFVSRNPSIQFNQDLAELAEKVRPGDLLLIHSLSPLYFAPLATNNRITTAILNDINLSTLIEKLAKAHQDKSKIYILQEILEPEATHKQFFNNLVKGFLINQQWLQGHYHSTGQIIEVKSSVSYTLLEIVKSKKDILSLGTWNAVRAGGQAIAGGTNKKWGFKFTTKAAGSLTQVKHEQLARTINSTWTGKIFTDNSGSPDTQIGIDSETWTSTVNGIKTAVFPVSIPLAAATSYWFVAFSNIQAGVTLATVVDEESFESGIGEPETAIKNNLANSEDWRIAIEF
jgi:hypothetical protein